MGAKQGRRAGEAWPGRETSGPGPTGGWTPELGPTIHPLARPPGCEQLATPPDFQAKDSPKWRDEEGSGSGHGPTGPVHTWTMQGLRVSLWSGSVPCKPSPKTSALGKADRASRQCAPSHSCSYPALGQVTGTLQQAEGSPTQLPACPSGAPHRACCTAWASGLLPATRSYSEAYRSKPDCATSSLEPAMHTAGLAWTPHLACILSGHSGSMLSREGMDSKRPFIHPALSMSGSGAIPTRLEGPRAALGPEPLLVA